MICRRRIVPERCWRSRSVNEMPLAGFLGDDARRYAVKELARRAGVSREFFLTWKIDVTAKRTTISFGPDGSKKIHFEHASGALLEKIGRKDFPVARAGWSRPPGGGIPDADLIIPFCQSDAEPSAPLFQQSADREIVCRLDLLLSLLLTTGRAEESWSKIRDEHGRFPAAGSIAVLHDFLERPIVDEWGLALEQELVSLLPSWQPQPREFRVKLTHDIDQVGIPFSFRSLIGHAVVRRKPGAVLEDLTVPFTGGEPAELRLVHRLAEISRARGLHSAFFWKASPPGRRDSGYDPLHPKIQRVIRGLVDQGFEVGVHPGYETFGSRQHLSGEVNQLREALGVKSPGGRQHYLRWSPETWLDWEACGLAYDSTVGFADRIGFRAGTCFPYRPWSLRESRELDLIEVPLIVMDCTPVKYMGLPKSQGLERIRGCIQRATRVGGVFTLLWHNVPLIDPAYNGWYEPTLDMLKGGRSFNLPSRPDSLW
jgi:hypothetical protein